MENEPMVMTKQESAAKAREAKAEKARLEAAADVAKPEPRDLQAEAQAGYAEVSGIDPTSYVYVGELNAVQIVVDGSTYDARKNDPVHLPHPVKALDEHPDFERVPA
jgi:hypothetical protein